MGWRALLSGDCSDESEQITGLHATITEHLAVPFRTSVLAVEAAVDEVDLRDAKEIIIM